MITSRPIQWDWDAVVWKRDCFGSFPSSLLNQASHFKINIASSVHRARAYLFVLQCHVHLLFGEIRPITDSHNDKDEDGATVVK